MVGERAQIESEWLSLTRETLPALAAERGWPVRNDHCFQRILLDNACGGVWYEHISGRPAYRCAELPVLQQAVRLGQACVTGGADLLALNERSLIWRGKRGSSAP